MLYTLKYIIYNTLLNRSIKSTSSVCLCASVPVFALCDESPAGLHLNIQASLHRAHLHVLVQVSVHVALSCGQFQLQS